MRQPRVDRLRTGHPVSQRPDVSHIHMRLLPSQPAHLDLVTAALAFLSGLLILS